MSKFIYAIATLSGTMIGVGLFSLPYITLRVGFWVMLSYFFILGILVILIHQFFGELSLKTPDLKRLPGFAYHYLGKWGRIIAFLSSVTGIFGAILAYLVVGGEFLKELLSPVFGGGNLIWILIYFSFGAFLIFSGIKAISKIEFWGLILFFLILILIFFQAKIFINPKNLLLATAGKWEWSLVKRYLFLPYGAILFSLWGTTLIPQIEEILSEKKHLLKKAISISILISILVYLFFIYLVLGITGSQTSESAITGLKKFLGNKIINLVLFFGVLTTFTSFIALGLTLKQTFRYDLKINKNIAWAITCFVPLILFLIGVKQFIPVISFVGGVMLAIEGILILLMYQKIHPQKIIIYPLFLIFIGGIVYEIFNVIK